VPNETSLLLKNHTSNHDFSIRIFLFFVFVEIILGKHNLWLLFAWNWSVYDFYLKKKNKSLKCLQACFLFFWIFLCGMVHLVITWGVFSNMNIIPFFISHKPKGGIRRLRWWTMQDCITLWELLPSIKS